jgi:DNA polymerase-4
LDDTIDIPRLKSILVGMVEKLAFQLRSEGLTSTVVKKIRYSNFDTETAMPDPIHFCRSYLTRSDGIIRQAIPTYAMRLIGIRFSGLVAYQINMFEDRGNAIALSGDGSNEKTLWF